ncbi:MAG: hypothetical protein F7C82_02420, partial [Desulfurococcales archaeon]|nr:hypothetical protein [Desulfurococcales archaeon]
MKIKPLTEFFENFRQNDVEGLWMIPDRWRWVKIKDIAIELKPGFARSRAHISSDGVPHLRPNNIGLGSLILDNLVKVKLDNKINPEEYYLKKGDVLFNNTNSYELVGRAALVKEDLP